MRRIQELEASTPRKNLPEFRPGDTVRVEMEIVEGDKKRVQAFQGTVIQRKGSGTRETFTVRKISAGVGVERIFPTCAPGLVSVEVVHEGNVRRAKLWYLRDRKGKSAQVRRRIKGKGSVKIVEDVPELEPAPAAVAEENSAD